MNVDLDMMLAARERRVMIQNNMFAEAETGGITVYCVVCLTLNIAGEIKRTPMTRMLFGRGLAEFGRLGFDMADHIMIDEATGSEAFWLVKEDGARVKKALEDIEDSFPAARLFDFDVLVNTCGSDTGRSPLMPQKLSRGSSRKCLICDRPAAECARSRAHGLDAIKAATQDLLRDFCADTLAKAAYDALLSELYTTPKPGLVDLNNNGAHSDMDVRLFEKSAVALVPYFRDAAMLGMRGCGMAALRERGVSAERDMFAATDGVNTHKGMIYSMGLILAGAGKALAGYSDTAEDAGPISGNSSASALSDGLGLSPLYEAAIINASQLAREDAEKMLSDSLNDPATNGAYVYKKYGVPGATGHAAAGFPDALYCADRLRYYNKALGTTDEHSRTSLCSALPHDITISCSKDHPALTGDGSHVHNEAAALALCDSMARLKDTNLLHRGGREGLEFVQKEAARISGTGNASGSMTSSEKPCEWVPKRITELEKLDAELISQNLSPGGSADMLALAFLLMDIEDIFRNL